MTIPSIPLTLPTNDLILNCVFASRFSGPTHSTDYSQELSLTFGAMVLPVQPALTPRSYPIFRPVLCVQYKGEYSCMLRTTSNQDPKALMVLKQFHDDMQALRLEPPIEPDKVEFIKKSSQVKATYSVRHRVSVVNAAR